MRNSVMLAAVVLVLAGCAKSQQANIVSSVYPEGVQHKEPVFFNGKLYDVTFAFKSAANAYDMTVAGQGRALGNTPGDQKIVEQVSTSALGHFACPTGQRGQVVPGTPHFAAGSWALQARCG